MEGLGIFTHLLTWNSFAPAEYPVQSRVAPLWGYFPYPREGDESRQWPQCTYIGCYSSHFWCHGSLLHQAFQDWDACSIQVNGIYSQISRLSAQSKSSELFPAFYSKRNTSLNWSQRHKQKNQIISTSTHSYVLQHSPMCDVQKQATLFSVLNLR